MRGDIADRDAVKSLMERCQPDAIVNFAVRNPRRSSIDGPRSFCGQRERDLRAARGGASILVATRTGRARSVSPAARFYRRSVRLPRRYGQLPRRHRLCADSPYSASKASSDHFARAYYQTYGLPVLITNCSNNYGYFQFPEKLIPLTILNAVGGRELPIYGDGGNVRDWLFVEDHCEGIAAVLERGQIGESTTSAATANAPNLEVVAEVAAALEERGRRHSTRRWLRWEANYLQLRTLVPTAPDTTPLRD